MARFDATAVWKTCAAVAGKSATAGRGSVSDHARLSGAGSVSHMGDHVVFRPHSRLTHLLSLLFVTLYIVASGRNLVPGLCATQRAVESCCAKTADESPKYLRSVHAPRPKHPKCGLCNLVLATVQPSKQVALPIISVPAHYVLVSFETGYHTPEVGNLSRPRDPPHASA